MAQEKDVEGRTPAEERAEIGTPAGEPPARGRRRHKTGLMHPDVCVDVELAGEGEVDNEVEDEMALEEFSEGGEEISTTGGITGTHVHGGIPAGGTTQGGTSAPKDPMRSGDYKKNR